MAGEVVAIPSRCATSRHRLEERECGALELVVHDPDGYAITFTGDT